MHKLSKIFTFEAAHQLPHVPPGHKCGRLHGHSYRLEIIIMGNADKEQGWVMDFGAIKNPLQPILEILDHSYLNEIPGLENPTSENIARWIWERLKPELPPLNEIIISETATSCCSYRG
ncbi:MAG TPA: 6-carboxytetrahydropterin synthase QueD [Verrucomicrobiota bacterium]|nr:6-carboxytetrahydropterin synthase QueD [Verrucomicrobiota bacterium]